ncbi:MAG: phasin family protein [Gammaproteobacteria bacterium]|nr:phasin family protein [Gammaproteobacteria bacterium]
MKTSEINNFMAPAIAFNQLVLKNVETVIGMQLDSFKAYADLGFKNLNAGLEVKTIEELNAYVEDLKAVAKKVNEQVTGDLEALGKINAEFIEEARKLPTAKKAAPVVKKAA